MRNPVAGTVEVFRTNVMDIVQAEMLAAQLQQHFPGSEVHFDLEDCDKILRIEGINFEACKVMALIAAHGFNCMILE